MAAAAVRRADFLMALAYATDLATGHSRDFALRSCVLAMGLAEVAKLDEATRRAVYHQALLRYIGCNADTHLLAAAWGDEIALRRDLHRIDMGDRSEFVAVLVRAITRTLPDAPPEELAAAVQRGLAEAAQVNIPILSGHCEVAQRIAERIGLAPELRETLGQIWAAYTHDIGELAVPVSTWMRASALTERETDTAQLHPYHGERALASLGGDGKVVAALVQRHHERLDGSGYHRNSRGPDLSPGARILAAAEAFQTAREARPQRPALTDAAAAAKVRGAVKEGGLCPDAVEAVLTCAGQRAHRTVVKRLAGLTPREIEVLRLIAAGDTAKEAARKLDIAPKTADNHIQSLYSKIGVTTRAGAALYALERGLVQHEISAA